MLHQRTAALQAQWWSATAKSPAPSASAGIIPITMRRAPFLALNESDWWPIQAWPRVRPLYKKRSRAFLCFLEKSLTGLPRQPLKCGGNMHPKRGGGEKRGEQLLSQQDQSAIDVDWVRFAERAPIAHDCDDDEQICHEGGGHRDKRGRRPRRIGPGRREQGEEDSSDRRSHHRAHQQHHPALVNLRATRVRYGQHENTRHE